MQVKLAPVLVVVCNAHNAVLPEGTQPVFSPLSKDSTLFLLDRSRRNPSKRSGSLKEAQARRTDMQQTTVTALCGLQPNPNETWTEPELNSSRTELPSIDMVRNRGNQTVPELELQSLPSCSNVCSQSLLHECEIVRMCRLQRGINYKNVEKGLTFVILAVSRLRLRRSHTQHFRLLYFYTFYYHIRLGSLYLLSL